MDSAPMEEPVSMSCQGRPLHWDKIAKLWVCDSCGVSLSYTQWDCGGTLECGADRLPGAAGTPYPRHTYLRRRRA